MATNAQLIARLRQAKKDTVVGRPQRTDDTYAGFLTDAQNFLNEQLEICQKSFTLNLSAGTREYALDTDFLKFPSDRLRKRSGLVYWGNGQLEPTDASLLDDEKKGWRLAAAGTPEKFYTELGDSTGDNVLLLGLDVTPSAAFVASVPSVTYYGVYQPAAIAAGSADEPFDSNPLFRGLHMLLILHALWTLEVEDGNLAKADERWARFTELLEASIPIKPGKTSAGQGMSFDRGWKS